MRTNTKFSMHEIFKEAFDQCNEEENGHFLEGIVPAGKIRIPAMKSKEHLEREAQKLEAEYNGMRLVFDRTASSLGAQGKHIGELVETVVNQRNSLNRTLTVDVLDPDLTACYEANIVKIHAAGQLFRDIFLHAEKGAGLGEEKMSPQEKKIIPEIVRKNRNDRHSAPQYKEDFTSSNSAVPLGDEHVSVRWKNISPAAKVCFVRLCVEKMGMSDQAEFMEKLLVNSLQAQSSSEEVREGGLRRIANMFDLLPGPEAAGLAKSVAENPVLQEERFGEVMDFWLSVNYSMYEGEPSRIERDFFSELYEMDDTVGYPKAVEELTELRRQGNNRTPIIRLERIMTDMFYTKMSLLNVKSMSLKDMEKEMTEVFINEEKSRSAAVYIFNSLGEFGKSLLKDRIDSIYERARELFPRKEEIIGSGKHKEIFRHGQER